MSDISIQALNAVHQLIASEIQMHREQAQRWDIQAQTEPPHRALLYRGMAECRNTIANMLVGQYSTISIIIGIMEYDKGNANND